MAQAAAFSRPARCTSGNFERIKMNLPFLFPSRSISGCWLKLIAYIFGVNLFSDKIESVKIFLFLNFYVNFEKMNQI